MSLNSDLINAGIDGPRQPRVPAFPPDFDTLQINGAEAPAGMDPLLIQRDFGLIMVPKDMTGNVVMTTWIIIACGIGASYYFSDVRSPHVLENLLAPLLLLMFVLAAVIKLVLISGTASRGPVGGGDGGGFAGFDGSHNSSNGCGRDSGGGEC